jgi:hypothetical protein
MAEGVMMVGVLIKSLAATERPPAVLRFEIDDMLNAAAARARYHEVQPANLADLGHVTAAAPE